MSATLTSLAPSGFQSGYDIHVTVTYDGTPSSPFPVFINTPHTMTTSVPGEYCNGPTSCGCTALGYNGYAGYAVLVNHGIADLNGTPLSPIILNETLEKQQFFISSYAGRNPTPRSWMAGDWTGSTFQDVFSTCSNNPNLNPPPTPYNPSGGTAVFNETQKFWIGSVNGFQGSCVQRGIVTLYTNHGTLTNYETPILNKYDCDAGNVIN